MRKLFFVLLLSCIGILVQAAPVKIALIGNSPETDKATDIALAELSKESEIILLERKEINKITAEHKLSSWSQGSNEIIRLGKLLNVDIFAVLLSENKDYFFVVFDAKSAVRLIDQQLSGKSPEALAANIGATLKQTIPKLQKENSLRKITLFSIRNVELPRNKDVICNKIAAKLVRKIGQLPDFAVIEGRYIGLINKERELTQISSSLSQASFLLNIGFYQSDIKDHTLIKLEIKVPGQESKHFTNTCNLQTLQISQQKINKIVNYMRQTKQKIKISPKAEAARYYEEFKNIFGKRKYTERLSKIEAAVAYDNSNRKYQQELLRTIAGTALEEFEDKKNTQNPERKINLYLDYMERWDKLTTRYKFNPHEVSAPYLHISMCYKPLLRSINGFDPLNGNHWKIPAFSEATHKRISNLHHRYVRNFQKQYRLAYWMKADTKLSNTYNMHSFSKDLNILIDLYYPSQNEYLRQSIPILELYLKKTAQSKEPIAGISAWHFWNRFFVCFKNFSANSSQFTELEKISEAARKHPWPFIKLYGTFALYLSETKKNPTQYPKSLDNFLNRMTNIFNHLPKKQDNPSLNNLYKATQLISCGSTTWVKIQNKLQFQQQMKDKLIAIMKQRREAYFPLLDSIASKISSKQSYDLLKTISNYLNSRKWHRIGIKNNKSTLKFMKEKISYQLVKYLNRNPQLQKSEEKQVFSFTKLLPFKHKIINVATCALGRYIYWSRYEDRKIKIYSYDTVKNKTREIGKGITVDNNIVHENIATAKNYLAISLQRLNLVIVFNLKTGKTTKISLPFERPKHIAIVDDNLLVWCAKDKNLLQYQLPSSKYKVIYASNRPQSSSDPFDNAKIYRLRTMLPDQKRERAVLFLLSRNRSGLWYYYPKQQKFEYASQYPAGLNEEWTKLNQDEVLFPSSRYSILLNLSNNTKKLLFYVSYSSRHSQRRQKSFEYRYGLKTKIALNMLSSHYTLSAATIAGNYFWISSPWRRINLTTGERTFYATPKEINNRALLLLTINDKTLLLVNTKGIFKLHINK